MDGCHQMKHRCETTSAAYHDSSPAIKKRNNFFIINMVSEGSVHCCLCNENTTASPKKGL